MLEQPLLQQASDAQWHDGILKGDGRILVTRFWNRRKDKDEALSINLNIFDPPPDYFDHTRSGGGISLLRLPDALVTEPILAALMEAVVGAIEPDRVEIGRTFAVKPTIDRTTLSDMELAIIRQRGHDIKRPDYAQWNETAKQVDGGLDSPVWRFWLNYGQPWPLPGWTWLEAWQSEPADVEEPRWGGTLYTWHKYAPWNLPEACDWRR